MTPSQFAVSFKILPLANRALYSLDKLDGLVKGCISSVAFDCSCLDAGTTKRGIGPAYASKATRNGIRVGDLRNMEDFADKLRKLAWDGSKRFEGWQYDVEADIARYDDLRNKVCSPVYPADTVPHNLSACLLC